MFLKAMVMQSVSTGHVCMGNENQIKWLQLYM